jgi:hypothetical protein
MNCSMFYDLNPVKSDSSKSTNTNAEEEDPWEYYSLNMQSSAKYNEEEHEKGFLSVKIHKSKK